MFILFPGSMAAFVGDTWLLLLALQGNIWRKLGSLFVPFVIVIFGILHRDTTKKAFLTHLAAIPIMTQGLVLGGISATNDAMAMLQPDIDPPDADWHQREYATVACDGAGGCLFYCSRPRTCSRSASPVSSRRSA